MAPSVEEGARAVLAKKTNMRVVTAGFDPFMTAFDVRSILGAMLWQERDVVFEAQLAWNAGSPPDGLRAVTKRQPTADEWDAALAVAMPSPEAVRGFAARVVHACRQSPVPESLVRRLPKVREYLTRLRQDAFLEIRAGYVDSGAAPGKDTAWKDPAQLKPETTTKEEVAARKRKRR